MTAGKGCNETFHYSRRSANFSHQRRARATYTQSPGIHTHSLNIVRRWSLLAGISRQESSLIVIDPRRRWAMSPLSNVRFRAATRSRDEPEIQNRRRWFCVIANEPPRPRDFNSQNSVHLFVYLSVYLSYICCVCRKHIFGHVLRIDASLDLSLSIIWPRADVCASFLPSPSFSHVSFRHSRARLVSLSILSLSLSLSLSLFLSLSLRFLFSTFLPFTLFFPFLFRVRFNLHFTLIFAHRIGFFQNLLWPSVISLFVAPGPSRAWVIEQLYDRKWSSSYVWFPLILPLMMLDTSQPQSSVPRVCT